ncbi:MAG: EpsD family peptidyl-prolyl cis-trans isomerase, partial [Azoarcus sp.]|nr:EpsD family peptidyl-prolyl cis-trans isomerase [Azoarcus sp.]
MSCSVRRVVAASCVAALLVGTLAGCGSKEESSKPASQVAVKVNKEEITVHQIDTQFDTLVASRGGNIPSDQIDRARSAVVERLIDQELFLQKAKENKLDRNPKVQQMIDLSRREILARAYSEQVMNGAPRPTDQQIKDYFDKNPALFAERRVYTLQEINIQVPPERFDEVHARVQAGGNIQALKDWLKEQKMPFVENSGTKPAEQLPFEILGSLAKASPGQATFIRIPSGALLLWVVGIQDAPITLNNARRVIENYL